MGVNGFDTSIAWSKFKKVTAAPSGKNADAETFTDYNSKNIRLTRKGNAIIAKTASVSITINPNESWVVRGKTDSYLLKHEQGHYDISALAAREFYWKLMKLEATDEQAFSTSMQEINDAMQQKIDETNTRYDKQTDHSRNKTEQQTWSQKIDAAKKNPKGIIDDLP